MKNNDNLSSKLGNEYNRTSTVQKEKSDFFQNVCVLPFILLATKGTINYFHLISQAE